MGQEIGPEDLCKILEDHKNWIRTYEEEGKHASLSGADLSNANLSGADLSNANLYRTDLSCAHLNGAHLNDVELSDADLSDANLSNANLSGTYLYRAHLNGAHLNDVELSSANLSGANLSGANLTQVKNLSINKLSKVKTLYKAKLDPELIEQVREKYPHLLEEPKLEE